MAAEQCEWCELSDEERRWLLSRTEHWSVYLADEQDYIGRCIVAANRHCGGLSELGMREWDELKRVIDELERCLKEVLGAQLCNWSCLMNSFYKSDAPNPHLHIHVRPRYRGGVVLNGREYTDEEYGHHYRLGRGTAIPEEDMRELFERLRAELRL